MMDKTDWDGAARRYLDAEKMHIAQVVPPMMPIFLEWRNGIYLGGVQHPFPGYDEIVLLSKTSLSIAGDFERAVKEVDPKRIYLSADPLLDLEGTLHMLRMVGSSLQIMTPEQTTYSSQNICPITETNTGSAVSISQIISYSNLS